MFLKLKAGTRKPRLIVPPRNYVNEKIDYDYDLTEDTKPYMMMKLTIFWKVLLY